MDSSIKAIIFMCLCEVCYATDFSLMLSAVEEDALNIAQKRAQSAINKQVTDPTSLRLDGIVYNHQKSWTIWINGELIRPGLKYNTIRIIKVTSEMVELIWNPSPEVSHQVCLRPNEVFQTHSY